MREIAIRFLVFGCAFFLLSIMYNKIFHIKKTKEELKAIEARRFEDDMGSTNIKAPIVAAQAPPSDKEHLTGYIEDSSNEYLTTLL